MTTNITIKRVEGKSGHYYLASDGAWSPDGMFWLGPEDKYGGISNMYALAFKQLIDSEAGGEVEEEPEVEKAKAGDWIEVFEDNPNGSSVVTGKKYKVVERDGNDGILVDVPYAGWISDGNYRIVPADFPKILAEQGEGE